MFKKLIHSVSVVVVGFVLALGGVAQATFDAVGVYDPDDDPHHNQVDQSGVYDSHTGDAGPENVIDLATFQALIGPAFDADAGGVVNIETTHGSLDGQDIIAKFGAKSLTISGVSGIINVGSSVKSGRTPISGRNRLAKSETANFEFDIGPITGGVTGEVVIYFGGSLLDRDAANLAPIVTATFSGGGTVTTVATMSGDPPSSDQDSFFGFVAPPGQSIVNVTFDPTGGPYTNLDDVAFITSAFVVVLKEASDPSPAKGATDVPRDVGLSWTAGGYADKHDVYFGTNFDDVNQATTTVDPGAVYQGRINTNIYTPPGRLAFGETYYWRVDEVNAPPDNTIHKGDLWQFTAELFVYSIENISATASSSEAAKGPENTVNGSGLDDSGLLHGKVGGDNMWLSSLTGVQPTWIEFQLDSVYKLHQMWVWNSNESLEQVIGFGFKDVSIEYSVNGTDYTTLGTTHQFAQAPGAPDYAHNTTADLSGVAAKYVRLTANSNWGGILNQYGLSEVRFFHIPVHAREPYPDYGATNVDVDVILGFRAGREAAKHDVYFSTDEQAVADGTAAVTTVAEAGYGPLSLDLGKTYYWRVDEVNEVETPVTWQGDIWDFTTQEYFVVDDFESYNDLDTGDPGSNRIFLTWIDGYGIPINGSVVGYENPPFAEQTIVHSGKQSMPLSYSNTGGAAYSEAERTFAVGQNWTQAGAATLVLYFHGAEGNTGQLYVKVDGSRVVYDGDAGDIAKVEWKRWNIDLASLGASLQNVTKLAIGIDGNGASGKLYLDDIRLYGSAPEPEAN